MRRLLGVVADMASGSAGSGMSWTCPDGHPVPEGQAFCGTCGLPAAGAADGAGDRPGGVEGKPEAPGGRWPALSSKRRGLVVVAAVVALLALVAAASLAGGGDDQGGSGGGEAERPPSTSAVLGPEDYCYEDLNSILIEATASGIDIDAYAQLTLVYGVYDERTEFLKRTLSAYSSDRTTNGTDYAAERGARTLMSWCEDNAEAFGYPSSG